MGIGAILGGVSSAIGIGNSLFGGGSSGGSGSGSASSAQTYDPYAPYRGAAASMYNNYLTGGNANPSQMPGFSSFESGVVQPGLQATQASMASTGQFASGAEELALNKQANQGYTGFMNNYLGQLTAASGAAQNPYNGGMAAVAGGQQQQANQANAIGQLQGAASGVSSLWGGGGATSASINNPSNTNSNGVYTGAGALPDTSGNYFSAS